MKKLIILLLISTPIFAQFEYSISNGASKFSAGDIAYSLGNSTTYNFNPNDKMKFSSSVNVNEADMNGAFNLGFDHKFNQSFEGFYFTNFYYKQILGSSERYDNGVGAKYIFPTIMPELSSSISLAPVFTQDGTNSLASASGRFKNSYKADNSLTFNAVYWLVANQMNVLNIVEVGIGIDIKNGQSLNFGQNMFWLNGKYSSIMTIGWSASFK